MVKRFKDFIKESKTVIYKLEENPPKEIDINTKTIYWEDMGKYQKSVETDERVYFLSEHGDGYILYEKKKDKLKFVFESTFDDLSIFDEIEDCIKNKKNIWMSKSMKYNYKEHLKNLNRW